MAYMDQDKKKQIADKVKPILKKYNMKGSLSVNNHSTIVLTLSRGPLDFIGNYNENNHRDNGIIDHMEINDRWYKEYYTGICKEFLDEIVPVMYSADWYDKSDIMTDYFNVAYYVDINVGKWNKPYILEK